MRAVTLRSAGPRLLTASPSPPPNPSLSTSLPPIPEAHIRAMQLTSADKRQTFKFKLDRSGKLFSETIEEDQAEEIRVLKSENETIRQTAEKDWKALTRKIDELSTKLINVTVDADRGRQAATKLTAAEKRIADLEAKIQRDPASNSSASKPKDPAGLEQRVSAIELKLQKGTTATRSLPPPAGDHCSANLDQKPDQVAAPASTTQLAAVEKRVSNLERKLDEFGGSAPPKKRPSTEQRISDLELRLERVAAAVKSAAPAASTASAVHQTQQLQKLDEKIKVLSNIVEGPPAPQPFEVTSVPLPTTRGLVPRLLDAETKLADLQQSVSRISNRAHPGPHPSSLPKLEGGQSTQAHASPEILQKLADIKGRLNEIDEELEDARELPSRVKPYLVCGLCSTAIYIWTMTIIQHMAKRLDASSKDIETLQQYVTPAIKNQESIHGNVITKEATDSLRAYLENTLADNLKRSLDLWKKKMMDAIKAADEHRYQALMERFDVIIAKVTAKSESEDVENREASPGVPAKRKR
ncbi:hypothetical protein BDK51DRAFT_46074 [Blyttiomyces helicus]|uniref:Uncharacterized protein n=1 Tax=Blyttiomyces helicus TaxID=388810 RepID=A0A4P9WEN4_9FUNG|nr:hypothetical protein BDK51DRAFT_46074 [Blyttiomyces helicus]|eukprot:RKO91064.1 hypothetical protein BDK51DRAFT_46074 [Blyttiomyces helicus]